MEIEITWYKDEMKDQVIALFENQYNTPPGYFSSYFEKFYFHVYQKNKCLLIVAMDGKTVAGFQSFFYWPYTLKDKKFNSFQSGNSLVHPGYRGKGIFQKMLAFIDQENKTLNLDFLMGFPVDASLRNFIKDNWKNILNLSWFLKVCSPFGFFPGRLSNIKNIKPGIFHFDEIDSNDNTTLRLSNDPDFLVWRKSYSIETSLYYTYQFKKDEAEILLHLKKNKRKQIFNELVIGNILFKNEASRAYLPEALKALNAGLIRSFSTHFISCAINNSSNKSIKNVLDTTGFRSLNKSIYFIVKPFNNEQEFLDASSWELYRSDIDTW